MRMGFGLHFFFLIELIKLVFYAIFQQRIMCMYVRGGISNQKSFSKLPLVDKNQIMIFNFLGFHYFKKNIYSTTL